MGALGKQTSVQLQKAALSGHVLPPKWKVRGASAALLPIKTHLHTIKSLFKEHDSLVSRVFRVVQLSLLLLEHFQHVPKETCTP